MTAAGAATAGDAPADAAPIGTVLADAASTGAVSADAASTGAVSADAASASGTFAAADAIELAVVERNGFVESRHVGSAVVLSPTGEILIAVGDPAAPIIPRSCLKPFQALAVLRALGSGSAGSGSTVSGTPLDPVQTVLATASHAGTPEHVAVVESILQLAGLTEDDLQCPHDWPGSSAARDALVRKGRSKSRLFMNCSGKHAAMLYACVLNGWPTATYLDPEHPLQQRIRATIEELTGEPVAASAVDGCGAPVHAVSLIALARGIGRITSAIAVAPVFDAVAAADAEVASNVSPVAAAGSTPDHASRIVSAEAAALTASVLANGWAIDGPGRANTLCIDELAVFSKLGAEGVMVMSTTASSPAPAPTSHHHADVLAAAHAERAGATAVDTAALRDVLAAAHAERATSDLGTASHPAAAHPAAAHRATAHSATESAVATAAEGNTAGTTVALKMLDGNLRAATLVGLSLLVRAGALTQASVDALLPRLDLTVYGGTAPVGTIRLTDALLA